MDSDFWTSRLAAAKRQYTLQHHHQSSHLGSFCFKYGSIKKTYFLFGKRVFYFLFFYFLASLDRLSLDDFEVEDEVRPDFPCPYCYEDFDIASLCSHLEDEHSCESKVTVSDIKLCFRHVSWFRVLWFLDSVNFCESYHLCLCFGRWCYLIW